MTWGKPHKNELSEPKRTVFDTYKYYQREEEKEEGRERNSQTAEGSFHSKTTAEPKRTVFHIPFTTKKDGFLRG